MTTPNFYVSASCMANLVADHGLSDTARDLRDMLADAAAFAGSMVLGVRREDAREALMQMYCHTINEDWDGEGAAAADPFSHEYASSLLDALPRWVPNPDIYVDPDGEFCLEWDYGPRKVFSVSIGRDGTLTFAGLFGTSKSHGVEPFTDSLPLSITRNLDRTIPRPTC